MSKASLFIFFACIVIFHKCWVVLLHNEIMLSIVPEKRIALKNYSIDELESRYQYYIGTNNYENYNFTVKTSTKIDINKLDCINFKTSTVDFTKTQILHQFLKDKKKFNITVPLSVSLWDTWGENFALAGSITKVRPCNCKKCPYLYKINENRHFGRMKKIFYLDTKWEKKKNTAVFYGGTTGILAFGTSPCSHLKLYNCSDSRFWLFEESLKPKVKNDTRIVIRVSSYVGKTPRKYGNPEMIDRVNLFKSKLIMVPEGNDVATNLKDAAVSKSVIVMPTPRVCSWFMENRLVPWVHYIPVDSMWQNLTKAVDWCFENDFMCQKIGEQATKYAIKFLDYKIENRLKKMVLQAASKENICEKTRMYKS